MRLSVYQNPSQKNLMGDSAYIAFGMYGVWDWFWGPPDNYGVDPRHRGGAEFAMADGHIRRFLVGDRPYYDPASWCPDY